MPTPTNDELLSQIRALGAEVHALRDEVERLKRLDDVELEKTALAAAPIPEPEPAPAPEKRPAPVLRPYRRAEPVSRPAEPVARPAAKSWALDEKFVGEKLTQYAGIVILTLGIVFFLVWTAAHAGPEVRVLLAAGAGAALIAAGLAAEKKPPFDQMKGVLIGGGWTVVYVTAYAAGHWAPTKIVDSPQTAIGVLLAAGGCMIAHAVSRRSRPLRLYAVALTYFVMLFCGQETSFDLFLILLAASAAIAVGTGEADVLPASLVGYYLNYVPVYLRVINTAPSQRTMENFLSPFAWIAGAYAIVAILPLIPKARRLFQGEQARIGEGALCLNSVLFALFAGSMGRVYFGVPHLQRAAALAALFAVPSLLYTRVLSPKSEAAGIDGVIALGLLAAAVTGMPDPMWKLLAWVLVSAGWVWVGIFFKQPVWRASGMAMALLTFAFYWNVASLGGESRREASMALFLFTALAYAFSRFHRHYVEDAQPWEKSSMTLWLHAGSLALVVGLWGVLDAAPFLCVLVALAVAAEHAAVYFEREDFWIQAALLEVGLGAYSFFVDYGADLPVAGVAPRLLTSAVVVGGYAYLYFDGPVSDELASRWTSFRKTDLRRAISWGAVAVAAFAVYRSFDGRARLPVWALWSLGLYWLGRTRSNADFKQQGVILAAVAAIEAGFTYLMAPSQLLSPLDSYRIVFFWGSCAALLGGLVLAKEKRWGEPSPLDAQAAVVFGLLPLVLGACYFAKELDRVKMTMAWTGLGLTFLVGGLALNWRELRLPALALLGLCVMKALFSDTANLPLPYRVASFVALGVVLLFASGLYVRAGSGSSE